MTFFNYVALFGGVGMFLYGMSIMGSGLEKMVSGKTEKLLERLTSSTWKGVLLGAGITGLIQSSAATTIIVIGLVNSGIMQFKNAVGIIMGANIGTTITGQIIRLSDISADNFWLLLLKPATLAPIASIIGAIFFVFLKDVKKKNIGQILLGFGILFTGMLSMEQAVVPLKTTPWFINLFTSLQNPILGVLAGIFVTVMIQSSSASVGILQALTTTGLVTYSSAVPIIFGQNIGTTVTGLLASTGTSKNARKVAFSHVYFNLIGTFAFMAIIYGVQMIHPWSFWHVTMNMGDIADFHTLFNVVTTLVFIPFSSILVKLAEWTVHQKGDQDENVLLDTRLYNAPGIAIDQAHQVIALMGSTSAEIFKDSVGLLQNYDEKIYRSCDEKEKNIDSWEIDISNYLVGLTNLQLSPGEGRAVTRLLYYVGEFERISDYADAIVESAKAREQKDISFTQEAKSELAVLGKACMYGIELTLPLLNEQSKQTTIQVRAINRVVKDMVEELRERHVERLKAGKCTVEAGILFLQILSDHQHFVDHLANVAVRALSEYEEVNDIHTTIKNLYTQEGEQVLAWMGKFEKEYKLPKTSG
ncbi:MAG: Na/Pi cotransporter family protein [Erysipelotrichaceae bacterium]|jgi:phosphate:Na+ symporter|nr:Na/Pi cotransporter family protein [Erysipelotrichaceae bacterium]